MIVTYAASPSALQLLDPPDAVASISQECSADPPSSADLAEMCVELLAGIAARDRDAFTRFYRLTSHRVFGVALRMLRNRAAAEEVTQEVYLQVWSSPARYDSRLASPIGWLIVLTRRRAIDRIRSDRAAFERDVRYGEMARGIDRDFVFETVQQHDERRTVVCGLGLLTELQRESIELAYFGGLTYSELADRLDIPLATVKSRIRDGLNRLRSAFAVGTLR
ncbi:sigma-70 family RNA polymerase sigma factor [Nocardia sp. NPDC056000]|uniref:sigma-70 family RNA polymerase sigma factor n=1 Tax=Nocardia sp. NPDC056000 TaxID=3345674 RepID=UPI0035DD7294